MTQVKRQFCRKGIHSCVPAVTLTFDNGARRLHWCADHASDAEAYRASSDQITVPITPSALPDPNKRGECAVKVSFTCDRNGRERLNPLAMLPDPKVSADYTQICQPCYEMLCYSYMKGLKR